MADDEVGQRSQKQSNILTEQQSWNAEAEAENDKIDQRSVSEADTTDSENSNNENFMSDDSIQNEAGQMQNSLYFLTTKRGSYVIFAILAVIIAFLVCRDIYMIEKINRLEKVLDDLPHYLTQTTTFQQIREQQLKIKELLDTSKRRQDQQAEILKFIINDVNYRLNTISKKDSEHKEYECYRWTPQDLNNIHWNYTIATEKLQCEYYPSNVFTQGKNERFPGCENCWCCTKVDGILSPRTQFSEPLKAESERKVISG